MNIVRLTQGKLFFDEFSQESLNSNWTTIPNDALRYSLIERPGYLKMFHDSPDLLVLLDEPDHYIIDIRNEYVPYSDQVQAGLVVFKTLQEKLEILEYYDELKDSSIVYQYLRLEKYGSVYTAYGKNNEEASWELVGSGEFRSAGKVGFIVKGPAVQGSSDYNVDYFRMYLSHEIQLLNIPVGYTVQILTGHDLSIGAQKVTNPYSGVKFNHDFIPPYTAYFKIFNADGDLIHTSANFDICGGDVYYYGAVPLVKVDSQDLYQDSEYFLGYFTDNEISFVINFTNPYLNDFVNIGLYSAQYDDDPGYQCVWFSNTIDGEYTQTLSIPSIPSGETISVFAKVVRNPEVLIKTELTPFKFNLALTY
jgi:hypothetical protein